MGIEVLLLVLGAAGTLGAGGIGWRWWHRRGQRDHVLETRTAWVRAARIIRYGPVPATALGWLPRPTYDDGVFGALGITDRAVIFAGQHNARYDGELPLVALRHISLVTVAVDPGPAARPAPQRALALHSETGDGWRVVTLLTENPNVFAQHLARATGLAVRDRGADRDDFGPAPAARLTLDASGAWTGAREGTLYLAPDRLLFDWSEAIPLDDIAHVDAFSSGAHSGGHGALLRLELRREDASPRVVGFAVADAAAWAGALARHGDVRIALHGSS